MENFQYINNNSFRKQLEEFSLLFRECISTYNPEYFIVDELGLFNPPDISQDYEQRDDELNFMNEEDEEYGI